MTKDVRSKIDQECQRIEEDSLFCAQTHYAMAHHAKEAVQRVIIWPAALAALLSFLSASAIPRLAEYYTVFSALAGLMAACAAIASGLGYDLAVSNHRTAGNLFTSLRHEARILRELDCEMMTNEQYIYELRLIRERYNAYVSSTEMTDKQSFEQASNIIKAGIFEYNVDKDGK